MFTFFTGILEDRTREWEESWIGGAGIRNHSYLIRFPFQVKKDIKTAAVFVASPNYYQLTLDGNAVRDTRLNNACTDYTKTILYETYPLKLSEGEHVLGMEIGNGWFAMELGERGIAKNEHLIAFQIRIEYLDGEVEWLLGNCDNCFCSALAPSVRNSILSPRDIMTPVWHNQDLIRQTLSCALIRTEKKSSGRILRRRCPCADDGADPGHGGTGAGIHLAGRRKFYSGLWTKLCRRVRLCVCGHIGQKITMRFCGADK